MRRQHMQNLCNMLEHDEVEAGYRAHQLTSRAAVLRARADAIDNVIEDLV